MTALEATEQYVCAGYYRGHPAAPPRERVPDALAALLDDLARAGRFARPGLFFDLDGAIAAARCLGGTSAPQGLWLPQNGVARAQREVAGTPLADLLRLRLQGPGPAAIASGHDVVGLGGDLVLAFVRETAGQDLCRSLGLPIDPPPFLPDARSARRLAAELNDDELGAPVLWVRCWRTVHSALE